MKNVLFGSFIVLSTFCLSQGWVPAGARSMSMANASVTFEDVWAYHNNPAALANLKTFQAGLSYENRFLLKELQSQGVAIAVPLKVGVISVGGHMYGYNRFRSLKGGLGYSLKLAEKFSAGVQLNYQGIMLSEGYGTKSTMTAEAGILARITENWRMGLSVFNLNRAKLSNYQDDRLSTIMRLGTSYTFSEKVLVSIEAEKDLDYALRGKLGLEYQIVDHFFLRGGVATAPLELSFGLGYHLQMIQIDFGTAYHQILGWSPHFSLVFKSKPKE